jgi:hypothetical protein
MGEHAAAGLVSLADRHDFRLPEIALVSELLMEIEDLDTMTTLTDNELREIVLQNKLPEEHIERHHMLRVLQSNGIGLIDVQRADDRLIAVGDGQHDVQTKRLTRLVGWCSWFVRPSRPDCAAFSRLPLMHSTAPCCTGVKSSACTLKYSTTLSVGRFTFA